LSLPVFVLVVGGLRPPGWIRRPALVSAPRTKSSPALHVWPGVVASTAGHAPKRHPGPCSSEALAAIAHAACWGACPDPPSLKLCPQRTVGLLPAHELGRTVESKTWRPWSRSEPEAPTSISARPALPLLERAQPGRCGHSQESDSPGGLKQGQPAASSRGRQSQANRQVQPVLRPGDRQRCAFPFRYPEAQ